MPNVKTLLLPTPVKRPSIWVRNKSHEVLHSALEVSLTLGFSPFMVLCLKDERVIAETRTIAMASPSSFTVFNLLSMNELGISNR